MLHDRIEDLSTSQGTAVRYLLSAVSKTTLQSTLTTLEQVCNRSVSYAQFTICCTVGAYLANPSDELQMMATKLITAALDRPNGLTLCATALEECTVPVTKDFLITLMTKELGLSELHQMQLAMALVMGSQKGRGGATEFLKEFKVSPSLLKEEDNSLRAMGLIARQTGRIPDFGEQLSPACGVTLFPPSASHPAQISVASVLRELGTGCVTTLADSREFLSIFPNKFTEKDVADTLGFFASQGTAPNDGNTYASLLTASGKVPKSVSSGVSTVVNAMPLLDALNEGNKFEWDHIIRLLDAPREDSFRLKNISVIFDAYHKFTANGEYPSVALFLGRWSNTSCQRVALEYIVRHPDKVNRKPLTLEAPVELLPATKPAGMTAAEMDLWRSFDFLEAAVHVASRDRDFHTDVFRPAAEKLPLLFLYTLFLGSYTGTVKNFATVKHILTRFCPPLDEVAKLIIPEAERRGRLDAIISMFSELTVSSPNRTVDVLEMVLSCKSVVRRFLKGSGSPRLVTAIAMCMDEAGEPSDKWLQKALDGKLHFRASCTENRFSVAMAIVEAAEMLQERQVYVASATAALNALMASPLKEMLKSVMECARGLLASTDSLFPEDVENDATEFFKKMYVDGHTAAAIATMTRLLKSTNARDRQLYACIVNIMFDESSAIACYPRKELQLFAALYGQMIAKELLPPNQQQRAWGLLLPAIVKPGNYAVEEYGVIALEQIKPRLADWPQFGRALRHIKDLDYSVPGIMAAINRGIKQEETVKAAESSERAPSPSSPNNCNLPMIDPAIVSVSRADAGAGTPAATAASAANSVASKFHTHDIGTLLTNRTVTAPPRVIQEQMNFLIGNTDVHKLGSNARELSQLLRPEYFEYFADYLVVKRAALEPNYHSMYIELVGKLQSKDLDRALRAATIAAVKRLLASEKIRSDSSERVLLRNLGSWLGSITLEKSIPILHHDLSFKDLLCQGLREGKLIPVVSFMTRVLNSCAKSRFFCCPNPWTMGQLCLLLNMYHLKHLKITLRFEVELICKNLNITLPEVDQYRRQHLSMAATEVHLEDICKEIDIAESPDFRVDEDGTGSPDPLPRASSTGARPLQANAEPFQPKDNTSGSPAGVVPSPHGPPAGVASPAPNVVPPGGAAVAPPFDIPQRPPITITPETVHVMEEDLTYIGSRVTEYRQLLCAMLRSVVEECYPTIARSATLAVLSSYSVIIKDFTRDPSADGMYIAGEGMSRSLAASLCYATVREGLPAQLEKGATALEERVIAAGAPGSGILRQSIASANMDLCLRTLEYMAGEEAANQLRTKLSEAAHEKMMTVMKNEPLRIPQDQLEASELLRVLGGNLIPSGRMPPPHREVYNDFFNCMPAVSVFNIAMRSTEDVISRYYAAADKYPRLNLETLHTMQSTSPKIVEAVFSVRQNLSSVMGFISAESAIYYMASMVSKMMVVAATTDRLTKELAKPHAPSNDESATRTLQLTEFLRQVYLRILQECLERGGEPVREEFTRIYLKNESRYSFSKMTADLLRIKAITLHRLDEDLAKTLQTTSSSAAVTFASDLISTVIVRDKVAVSKDMRRTLSVLDYFARSRLSRPATLQTPTVAPSPSHVTTPPLSKLVASTVTKLVIPTTTPMDEQCATVSRLLDEWIQTWARSKTSHRPHSDERNPSVDFVKTLQQNGMLETANLSVFLGLSIRFCVEHYATASLALERENAAGLEGPAVGTKPGSPPSYRTPYSAKLFQKCDGFTDLVLVLLRCCSLRNESTRDQRAEITLLRRVLDMFLRVLTNHHETIAQGRFHGKPLPADTDYMPVFQQQPYVRLISNLMMTIQRQESVSNRDMSEDITLAFQTILHRLHPSDYPAFAFGWLELVAHRTFIPRCVRHPDLWPRYTELLVDALRFVEFLTQGNMVSPNGLVFYKAVFKLMLVLLHDYPLFLISQHYPLCDAIPQGCVQMLNTVLSSFPPEMRLPEPFQHVASDRAEMMKPIDVTVHTEYMKRTFAMYDQFNLLPLTRYMTTALDDPIPETVMKEVLEHLAKAPRRNLMNAVVLHVAASYLEAIHNAFTPAAFANSNAMRLYRYICAHCTSKVRYQFLCACAHHLRFPNLLTNVFATVIFSLFLPDSTVDAHTQTCIQEQITRVVAEKTVIVQPHPWGVLNTFVEIMSNPKFHFWDKAFIHTQFLEPVFMKLRRTVETRNNPQQQQQAALQAQLLNAQARKK